MTRYSWRDERGNTLYRGETINGRTFTPATRRGYGPGVLMAVGIFMMLDAVAGVNWLLAAVLGGLAGQFMINLTQRSYSRRIFALVRPERNVLEGSEQEREAIARAEALQEKIRLARMSLEAELPYIDYDSGEIIPTASLGDWIAERQADAARELDLAAGNRPDDDDVATGRLDFHPASVARRPDWREDLMIDEILDADAGIGPDHDGEIDVLGRQADLAWGEEAADAAHVETIRRAKDRAAAREMDRQQFDSWAAAPWSDFAPGRSVGLPSGRVMSSEQVNKVVHERKAYLAQRKAYLARRDLLRAKTEPPTWPRTLVDVRNDHVALVNAYAAGKISLEQSRARTAELVAEVDAIQGRA